MLRTDILFDERVLPEKKQQIQQYPAEYRSELRTAFFSDIAPPMLTELRFTPGSVVRPIQWQTPKQRAAFFATNGFGRGIPTKRTGKTQAGWYADINVADNAVIMTVGNKARSSIFVTGRRQQRMHANTGWRRNDAAINYWRNEAADMAFDVARRTLKGLA